MKPRIDMLELKSLVQRYDNPTETIIYARSYGLEKNLTEKKFKKAVRVKEAV